jgi:predicted RNA polymerase sigma factor
VATKASNSSSFPRSRGKPALLHAVRAHLLDRVGHHDTAREHYHRAARCTLSLPEQLYLLDRAARR